MKWLFVPILPVLALALSYGVTSAALTDSQTASGTVTAEGFVAPTPTPTPTPTPAPTPTPTPTPAPSPSLHVGDLDGAAKGKRNWWATVTVYVHDVGHRPLEGATVIGHWSGDTSGASFCLTSRKGKCTVASPRLSAGDASVTFTVASVSLSGYTYEASVNHDPDGDSDGTSVTVTTPRPAGGLYVVRMRRG